MTHPDTPNAKTQKYRPTPARTAGMGGFECQIKKSIIIAGPNGAGKTTFALEYLPNEADCPVFVNADLIAAGLSPFRPATAAIRAGRLMLGEINAHARAGRSFRL